VVFVTRIDVDGTLQCFLSIMDSRSHIFHRLVPHTVLYNLNLSNVLNVIRSIARSLKFQVLIHKSLSSYVIHSAINDTLSCNQGLSGFRLDLIVKPFPLLSINNVSPCSSRGPPIVAADSCHMFSTLHETLSAYSIRVLEQLRTFSTTICFQRVFPCGWCSLVWGRRSLLTSLLVRMNNLQCAPGL